MTAAYGPAGGCWTGRAGVPSGRQTGVGVVTDGDVEPGGLQIGEGFVADGGDGLTAVALKNV